jgi:ABC-type multidrug transport system fused ATPase/permease subunit
VELLIPIVYKYIIRFGFEVLTAFFQIIFVTFWFLIPLVPIVIIYVFCQRYYIRCMRQLRRHNLTSISPIFSHFGESLTGVSTVRAYNAKNRFIDVMNDKIEHNLIFFYPDFLSNRYKL